MPEYTEKQKEQRRKAVAEYMKTVDRVNCQFPLGTKERIKELTGKSCNAFIKETILKELDKIERKLKQIKHKYLYCYVLTLGTNKYIIALVRNKLTSHQ